MTYLTTLIPAYKADHLGEVFTGLRRQAWQDFRVILSDDSPGGVITDMIRDGRFGPLASSLNLTVVRGPGDARLNHDRLLQLWGGQSPLVHFHLDDDVIFPDFYRAHVAGHAAGDYCATVSARWLSQDNSQPAWQLPLPAFIDQSPLHSVPVDVQALFASTVPGCQNWLGELSNMVLSRTGAASYPKPPTSGLSYFGLLDIGTLLSAAAHQPLLFLRDHLSVFRQHAAQTTHAVHSHGIRVAFLVWAATALQAWAEQRITAPQALQAVHITVQRCASSYQQGDPTMNRFFDLVQAYVHDLAQLHRAFTQFWLEFLASDPTTCPALPATPSVPAAVATRQVVDSSAAFA